MVSKLYRVSLVAEREIKNHEKSLQGIIDYNEDNRQQAVKVALKPSGMEPTMKATRAATRAAVRAVISVATKAVSRASHRVQTRASTRAATKASIRATNKAATRATTRAITRAVASAANREAIDVTYESAFDRFLRKELLPRSHELGHLAVTVSQGVGWSLGLYDASG